MSSALSIWRGANQTIVWNCTDSNGTAYNLSGSEFRLTVSADGSTIEKTSGDTGFTIDTGDSTVTWEISVAESRIIPLGRLSTFELEWRLSGRHEIVSSGTIEGLGGINDDD